MEDYELQEEEFWRKLAEEQISRTQMLRRSAAAAFGLTVLASPAIASAARRTSKANNPLAALIAKAKKEGQLNVIALPPDWANYGQIISAFQGSTASRSTAPTPTGARPTS